MNINYLIIGTAFICAVVGLIKYPQATAVGVLLVCIELLLRK